MRFPYTEFVIIDSLSIAIRSLLGSTNSTVVPTPPNPLAQFDTLCAAVAKSFDCVLYLEDEVRGTRQAYNAAATNHEVFIRRTPEEFITQVHGDRRGYSRYEEANHGEQLDELEEEKEEEEEDEERITEDFTEEALGWYYDVFKTDPKSPYKTIPRNVYPATLKENTNPIPTGDFDLLVKCPDKSTHILGYSSKGMVTFPRSTLYTDKLAKPVLRVPNGAGICLLAGVQDLYVLDQMFIPTLAFQFFPQFVRFTDGLAEEDARLAVLDDPVLTSLDDLIDSDIASKYRNLRVGSNIVQGECSYDYDGPGGIPRSSTMRHMVSRWGLIKQVVAVKPSVLCMSLDTLERLITVIDGYIPEERSVIYSTIERFVMFLYRAGYPGDMPKYENMTDAFVAYQNIKVINSQLVTTDGTLRIDLSPFSQHNKHSYLTIKNWKEANSNALYSV